MCCQQRTACGHGWLTIAPENGDSPGKRFDSKIEDGQQHFQIGSPSSALGVTEANQSPIITHWSCDIEAMAGGSWVEAAQDHSLWCLPEGVFVDLIV